MSENFEDKVEENDNLKDTTNTNSVEKEEILQNIVMKKISDVVKFAASPKLPDISVRIDDLIELAIELWRLENKIKKLPASIENQRESLSNSVNKLKRYLDKYSIEILDHTNQKYSDGQNIDVLSFETNSDAKETTIIETKEPTILCKGQIIHRGKVIVIVKNVNHI